MYHSIQKVMQIFLEKEAHSTYQFCFEHSKYKSIKFVNTKHFPEAICQTLSKHVSKEYLMKESI